MVDFEKDKFVIKRKHKEIPYFDMVLFLNVQDIELISDDDAKFLEKKFGIPIIRSFINGENYDGYFVVERDVDSVDEALDIFQEREKGEKNDLSEEEKEIKKLQKIYNPKDSNWSEYIYEYTDVIIQNKEIPILNKEYIYKTFKVTNLD